MENLQCKFITGKNNNLHALILAPPINAFNSKKFSFQMNYTMTVYQTSREEVGVSLKIISLLEVPAF